MATYKKRLADKIYKNSFTDFVNKIKNYAI